eukprot:3764260-Rhodomonas_salina.1
MLPNSVRSTDLSCCYAKFCIDIGYGLARACTAIAVRLCCYATSGTEAAMSYVVLKRLCCYEIFCTETGYGATRARTATALPRTVTLLSPAVRTLDPRP